MARPKGNKVGMKVMVWMDENDVARIDRLAETMGLTRSRMSADLVVLGLEKAEFLDVSELFTQLRNLDRARRPCPPQASAQAV